RTPICTGSARSRPARSLASAGAAGAPTRGVTMQELTNAVAEPTRLRHFGRAAIAVAGLGVLALVGCAAPASGPVGTWTSSPSASADEAPRLVVGADGSVTGDDGCNALEGRWDPADAQIAFSDVA